MEKPEQNQVQIKKLRIEIDAIDARIFQLLQQRFRLSKKIGKLKKKTGLMILDRKRESRIYQRLNRKARGSYLDLPLVKGIWKHILKKSYQIQQQVIDEKNNGLS